MSANKAIVGGTNGELSDKKYCTKSTNSFVSKTFLCYFGYVAVNS